MGHRELRPPATEPVSLADGGGHNEGPSETQSLRRDVRTSITGMRSGDLAASNTSRFHSRPQERRLNTGSRLYRAMLAPAAAPPGRPRVFPQAEKTNPGGSNLSALSRNVNSISMFKSLSASANERLLARGTRDSQHSEPQGVKL